MSKGQPILLPARHFIGGKFTDALSGRTFEVTNPATEETTTTAARGDADDVASAVRAAHECFKDGAWSRAKPSMRRKILFWGG
jgi:5-carboxymethyl-2-hydroxymuconic-semialdehyde dehydrogenase